MSIPFSPGHVANRLSGLCLVLAWILLPSTLDAAKGVDMDYGSLITYTISPPKAKGAESFDNVVTKGVAVKLNADAAVCFDTELMRWSAAWTGGFLDLDKTHMTSSKGSLHARISGNITIASRPRPGWAFGEHTFEDKRPLKAGSLPKARAHYRGLYRHRDHVVFQYSIAGHEILDMPGYQAHSGAGFFTRTLSVTPTDQPLRLLVGEIDDLRGAPRQGEGDGMKWMSVSREGKTAVSVGFKASQESVTPSLKWSVVDDSLIVLEVPVLKQAMVLNVAITTDPLAPGKRASMAKVLNTAAPDFPALRKGGPTRWPETITLKGRRALVRSPYVVDTLPVPESNPWDSWMRLISFDFFEDGRAAVATWNGDVWLVSGIDDGLKAVTWKRFAAGLFEGLGLRIVDGKVHVLERHQITRLHDFNGDGEADYYENVNNDAPIGPSYHAFSFGLETDQDGNFYFTRCGHRIDPELPLNGGVIQVSADGSTARQFATGMRAPNGLSVGPGDRVTTSDNQGNWVPTSRIDLIRPGGFYGYLPHARRKETPKDYDKPICWIPYGLDNSSGGQVWVTGNQWGLPEGQLLHISYGKSKLFHVLLDESGRTVQGAVNRFPLSFNSGIMRGRFHPQDGQLYLCGLKGWQTQGIRDAGLFRVRYTGAPLRQVIGYRVVKTGIQLNFSVPLDPESAVDPDNYALEQWNYLWSGNYGSSEYSVKEPDRKGRDPVTVKSIRLLNDQRTVVLAIEDFRPVMQMRIRLKIGMAAGGRVDQEIHATVNVLPD